MTESAAASQVIEIQRLRVQSGDRLLLSLDSAALSRGARGALIGPSGSGKTTLLSVLAGLRGYSAGTVRVLGEDMAALGARGQSALDRFRARRVGLVPQSPSLFAGLSVLENLQIARRFAGLPADPGPAVEALARLGLAGLGSRRPPTLSRGQQQRVALARALAVGAELLLADEPTANLDDADTHRVLDLLVEHADQSGATLLVATHDARVRLRLPVWCELGGPSTRAGA